MDQQQMMMMMPGMQPSELVMIQSLTKEMTENQKQQFFSIYHGKRKEKQNLLIMTLIGFFGFAGIQRFIIGETGMGILYFLTLGFCGIGTIMDLIKIDSLTFDYNQKQAFETASMVKMMTK
jgi:TM2 domain-containing membrane protein YozV